MAKGLIEDTTMTAIANAIREKNGTTDTYTPSQMAAAIQGISGGGGDIEIPIMTGDCSYRFCKNGWNWAIPYVTTKDVTSCENMFQSSDELVDLSSLTINCSSLSLGYIFNTCSKLEKLPKINCTTTNVTGGLNYMFQSCSRLREIPDNYLPTVNLQSSYWNKSLSRMFSGCNSLRRPPQFSLDFPRNNNEFNPYQGIFEYCYVLDSIEGWGVQQVTRSSNAFGQTFDHCSRIKDFTFEANQNANWSSQILDLSKYVGYTNTKPGILNFNSGITADKEVVDDATYQALKNDPDWFTQKVEYSRYNHDSAVRTINSLPDTSAYLAANGGTNTIKFTGAAGSATDGGAINTLTDEEIAVATTKGWTVTLV